MKDKPVREKKNLDKGFKRSVGKSTYCISKGGSSSNTASLPDPNVNILSPEISSEGESTENIRKRVISARKIQVEHYSRLNIRCNVKVSSKALIKPDEEGLELLKYVLKENYISNRDYAHILRVA
ncbi:MAG: hypothetical protein ACR5KV_08600, partial [Wolbachia sp.]